MEPYLPRSSRSGGCRCRVERSARVKILYVCHRFPFPPKRGGKIRPFNTIRHLSRQHQVTVASLARSEQEAKEGEGLAQYCGRYEIGRVRDWVQALRMGARLPTPTPSSMG